MNLHGIVRSAINTVNPDILATLKQSNGYDTAPDGTQIPKYTVTTGMVQVQSLTSGEIIRLNNLGLQGVMRAVYVYGNINGIIRVDQKGGDLLEFPEAPNQPNKTWKAVNILETWPDWSKVAVCLQST